MQGSQAEQNALITHESGLHVQRVIEQAQIELLELLRQKADIVRRIGTVKQTISGLANLFGESILDEELLRLMDRKHGERRAGFTQACRVLLMDAGRALSAREVCEQIRCKAPQVLERHKDPMASVTTVLNRFVAYGEAKPVMLVNGRRAWIWVVDEAGREPGLARAS